MGQQLCRGNRRLKQESIWTNSPWTSAHKMPTLLSIAMHFPGTCGEDETEAAQSTSRKKRFKKVRFSLHNRVYPISDTEEGIVRIYSLSGFKNNSFTSDIQIAEQYKMQ